MLPGTCATTARVVPDTSTLSTFPLSKCQAMMVSQVPLSGSSPIQHGQSTRQLQTSSKRPSRWYAIRPPYEVEVDRFLDAADRTGAERMLLSIRTGCHFVIRDVPPRSLHGSTNR